LPSSILTKYPTKKSAIFPGQYTQIHPHSHRSGVQVYTWSGGWSGDIGKIFITATAASAQASVPSPSASTPVAESHPVAPYSSIAEGVVAGAHAYSVVATNFDCICQVDGNTTASFKFTGNQLEFTNPGGVWMSMTKSQRTNTNGHSWDITFYRVA
jgi:hypothetical protein